MTPQNPPSDTEPAIDVDRLTHHYQGGKRPALDAVSFSVHRGEIVGLLGPNGAGKTTTLHAVLGLLRPTAGAVRVFGHSPLTQRQLVMPRLNFAAADVDLPLNLLGRECLRIFAKLYGVRDEAAKIGELSERFTLAPLLKRAVGTLSSGEHMRLKICKALLNDPDLLVLDEPTLSLDPSMAKNVRDLLRQIQRDRQMAILHTSHNMSEVEAFCDRILFLHQGRLLAEGSSRDVLAKFSSHTLEELFIKITSSGELIDER